MAIWAVNKKLDSSERVKHFIQNHFEFQRIGYLCDSNTSTTLLSYGKF